MALGRLAGLKLLLWPRPGERLLPAVSALLLALSFPPLHPLVLPFVGLVPMALWVNGLSADAEGRHAAVRGAGLFGAVYFGVLFYWILIALIWFSKLAILAFLGALVALVGVASLFGWTLHRAVHSVGIPLWLALPITWTAAEWFRAHLPDTLAFPWLGLGTSLSGFPELIGIAEIVGARGVTFWIASVNGLVAALVLSLRSGAHGASASRRQGAILAAVLLLPMLWGIWRANTLQMRPAGEVAVVQPNIPEHIKLDDGAALDSTYASLDRLMPMLPPGSLDLVVMPEVTVSAYLAHPGAADVVERVQSYSREVGAPVLIGALGAEYLEDGTFVPYNSAFVVEPQGLTGYQYDKRYLVPIMERVPIVPRRWLSQLQYFGVFGVGEGLPLAEAGDHLYGVLICYESTYAQAARSFRREGADVLLNITNDAWYGREPLYARTTALWQHPAHMVLRAIENRVGVARAANTGISLFIDPVGRVYQATSLFEADVRADTVYTTDVMTFYVRHGDLVGGAAALSALLLTLGSLWPMRRLTSLDPQARDV
ncbi:MAG: apolipoprotein N-acyltransferase [Gemmatimonadota bacterium]|nr:apolipoprotein N-acyltransferase [Gemmatimonadota bacterium]